MPSSRPEEATETREPNPSTRAKTLMVALVGNPNTGKTTLFNALTGARRHVANYPGVTVEVGKGLVRDASAAIELLDLPGTYSLDAVSPDETLVCDVLGGRTASQAAPDVVVAVVDASNLQRNLFLVSQLLELPAPVVVALTMTDLAAERGVAIKTELLSSRLGVEVIPVDATEGRPLPELVSAIERAARAAQARAPLERRVGESRPEQIRARYAWVAGVLAGVISRPAERVAGRSERIDAILTHRVWGALSLLGVLLVVFQALFSWAGPLMRGIESLLGLLGDAAAPLLPEGAMRSFIVDGVIGGTAGVLVFLPQIMILFAIIAALEDCGYLARAAFMMDRVMRGLGLSGRAFIPLLGSFACAVPAIMGTRTISDWRERFVTILIAPFMSCSARLPVYVLFITAFVPDRAYLGGWLRLHALVMLGMYLVGVVVAVPLAWILKSTAFAGPSSGFVMELPAYKRPSLRAIWQRMSAAGRGFVVNAGTVILAVNLVVWALGYFPRSESTRTAIEARAGVEGWDDARTEHELAGAYLRDSALGQMGRAIEPAVRPLGWDWRIGMAVIASFPAREVVIGTLGTIYNLGDEESESSQPLREALAEARWPDGGAPVFTLPVALSVMVFFALCAQCSSTLVMIGRETRSWLWPAASFVAMTSLAYAGAWLVATMARMIGV